jgi:precorrin-6B methylase 2
LWHDACVTDETISEQLRRESDEMLKVAAKLMEHGTKLIAQAIELEKQIARLKQNSEQNRKP